MSASSFDVVDVSPSETASGGKAVVCHVASGCTLKITIQRPAGLYNVAVQHFDIWRGVSRYELSVNGHPIAQWIADDTLPPAQFDAHLDGQDSTRFTAHGVHLKPGDVLSLRGIPDLRPELKTANPLRDYREFAPVDYIELGPDGPITPQ
jgi:alpha-glucuronidase